MRVDTERFGDVEIPDDRVLEFADGLPGFPEARRFALVDERDTGVFFWLQSLEDPALAFLSVVPWAFFPDYEPELPEGDQDALELKDAADALVLCLLSVRHPEGDGGEGGEGSGGSITANLLGPVVVNQLTRRGRQVVLADSGYPVRAPLPAA